MIGVSVATLQNREQGRCRPEGPARALLWVASKNPQAVTRAFGVLSFRTRSPRSPAYWNVRLS